MKPVERKSRRLRSKKKRQRVRTFNAAKKGLYVWFVFAALHSAGASKVGRERQELLDDVKNNIPGATDRLCLDYFDSILKSRVRCEIITLASELGCYGDEILGLWECSESEAKVGERTNFKEKEPIARFADDVSRHKKKYEKRVGAASNIIEGPGTSKAVVAEEGGEDDGEDDDEDEDEEAAHYTDPPSEPEQVSAALISWIVTMLLQEPSEAQDGDEEDDGGTTDFTDPVPGPGQVGAVSVLELSDRVVAGGGRGAGWGPWFPLRLPPHQAQTGTENHRCPGRWCVRVSFLAHSTCFR